MSDTTEAHGDVGVRRVRRRRRLLLLLLIGAGVWLALIYLRPALAPAPHTAPDALELYETYRTYVTAEDIDGAIAYFRHRMDEHPHAAFPHLIMAELMEYQSDIPHAREELAVAMRLDGSQFALSQGVNGDLAFREGHWDEALGHYRSDFQKETLPPLKAAALVNVAYCTLWLDGIARASQALEDGARALPSEEDKNLGPMRVILAYLGKQEHKADGIAQNLTARWPESVTPYLVRIRLFMLLGQTARARELCQQVNTVFHDNPPFVHLESTLNLFDRCTVVRVHILNGPSGPQYRMLLAESARNSNVRSTSKGQAKHL